MISKDGHYTITPKPWNSTISAGTSISLGGASKGGIGTKKPTNIKLTGKGISDDGEIIPPNPNPDSDSDKPLKSSIEASTIISKDGKYSITATLPNNHKATSFELFENNKVIKSGEISSNSMKFDLIKADNGNYEYYLKLINKNGSTTSNKITIKVDIKNTTTPETSNEWKVGVSYKIGDIVSYKGNQYKCIQPHTSLNGWEPSNVASLWKKL